MELNQKIGGFLAAFRKNRGITQERFAQRIGVTRGFLSDIERGTKSISVETLVRICRKTGLAPHTLLGMSSVSRTWSKY